MSFSLSGQVTIEQLLDKGYEHYIEDEFDLAIKKFDQAAIADPTNPENYFLRGLSYHGMKKKKKGINDLEKAIELAPDYVEAYQELGYIYLVGQAPKLAIEQFDKALDLDPTAAEVYVNRGTAKCMLDNPEGARKDWDKAMELGVQYSEYMKCE